MSAKRKTRKSRRRRNPAKQTSKRYRCTQCGHEQRQTTNHYGPTWSWGHANTCPKCPPYKKYPEFGGQTVWECMEPQSETRAILQNPEDTFKCRGCGKQTEFGCTQKHLCLDCLSTYQQTHKAKPAPDRHEYARQILKESGLPREDMQGLWELYLEDVEEHSLRSAEDSLRQDIQERRDERKMGKERNPGGASFRVSCPECAKWITFRDTLRGPHRCPHCDCPVQLKIDTRKLSGGRVHTPKCERRPEKRNPQPSAGAKKAYEVMIYDKDTQKECVIDTSAASERKAVSNGWFRLARMESGLSGPLFRSKNKDRYVVTARLK